MDLTFSAEERAFEAGSPRLHRRKSHAGNEARDRADAVGVLRSRHRHGLAASAAQKGLGRAGMAGGTWRAGLDPGAALDFRGRMRPRRHAQCQRDGRQDGRPRHHRLRLAGAEEFLSAAHSLRRGLLVPGLFRAGLRLRSRLAEDPRGARRRRLHRQRHQDLDHACASRQPHVRAGAHQRHARASRTASVSS